MVCMLYTAWIQMENRSTKNPKRSLIHVFKKHRICGDVYRLQAIHSVLPGGQAQHHLWNPKLL